MYLRGDSCSSKVWSKQLVEWQVFSVVNVTGDVSGLVVELGADGRYAPRCGQCGDRATYLIAAQCTVSATCRRGESTCTWSMCGGVHVETLSWASGKRQFTRALMVTLATWARILTGKQVATLFHCAWSTVEEEVDEAVTYGLFHRDLSGVSHVGIDEISRKRGACVCHQRL